jgi:two-component system, NtrC family, nitrogen regulation sensor histidine kinase NtrY
MSTKKTRTVPLQLKLTLLLVVIVMLPLGIAAYFIGDVGKVAANVAANEAQSRVAVLDKSMRTYHEWIDTTKRLHGEVAGRLAKRSEIALLDPGLAGAAIIDAFPIDVGQHLQHVLDEPGQGGLVGIAILRADGTLFAEATRPLAGPTWRNKVVDEPIGDSGAVLRLTFQVSATVNEDLEQIKRAIDSTKMIMQINETDVSASYRKAFLVLMSIAALVAIAIGIAFSTLWTRRIGSLVITARRVSEGQHDARVHLASRDELGELGTAFNTMLDDLEATRLQVEYLQRMGVWQDVARSLAHEIKNPLTPIQLAVQQCVSSYKGADTDPVRFKRTLEDTGEIVEEEIAALRRLVDTFRTLGALPKVEAAPLQLGELIEDLKLDPMMAQRIRLAPPDRPVTVRADKLLLKRVLANLVENGIYAGQEAGTPGDVVIGWAEVGDNVKITIDDHGKGVAAESREKIFEPYVTTKPAGKGTGLGLAIARKICIEHGGELRVAAERPPTGGARFVLSLPLRAPDTSL